jgi:S-layer protein
MTAATATTVQYLNLAYFGRPADPASLTAYPATGMTDEQIVEAFVSSNEYTTNTVTPATVGSTVNQTSLINTFYQRLFGRLAASEEIAGWTTALATGTVNEDYLGITIMRAGLNLPAGEEMRQVLEAKFASADLYTSTLSSDSASAAAYSTAAAISSAANFLSGITTTTAATASEAAAAVTTMVATGTPGETFTLTTGVDSISGTTNNDTISATESTLTQGDTISGGGGTDTLSITAATASLDSAPSDLTLDSVEAITIATTGNIGVTAVTGTKQVNKITFAAVTQNVQQVNRYLQSAQPTDTNAARSFTYGGQSGTFDDHDSGDGTPFETSNSLASAINAIEGSVVAFGGADVLANSASAQTGTDIIIDTIPTGFVPLAGMTITGTNVAAGTKIVSFNSTTSTITIDTALTSTGAANNAGLLIGGGNGGLTIFGPADGSAPPALVIGVGTPTVVSSSLLVTGVDGNEGDVVTFTYAGQSGQYIVGSTNDATATAFAAALNAVSSDGTAAVVAGTGDTDHVTLTANTEGAALGSLVFSGAGSNTPTVTTSTANGLATVNSAAYDVSGLTTDSVTVTLADSVNLKAAVGDDVNISGVSGAITLGGGKDVVVSDKTADANIDINGSTGSGKVTITDTKLGSGDITVATATDVTVVASAATTGSVSIGAAATDVVSGAVSVSYTGFDYDPAGANNSFGSIRVDGGTTVVVNATIGDSSKAATDTSSVRTHTFGAVRVDAGVDTSSVTITQDAAVAAVDAETAVAAKSVTQTITFVGVASGAAVTLTQDTGDTIVFTAAKALTATEIASAFANIGTNAYIGSAAQTLGSYTGAGTIEDGWSSGAVTTSADGASATVIFTTATAGKTVAIASSNSESLAVTTANAGATLNQAVTGRLGVVNSAIDINSSSTDDDFKTVNLTNYSSADIVSDVIETVNLSGTGGATIIHTASTGSVTANIGGFLSGSQFSVDGTAASVTGLTVNATGSVTTDLIATAATSLTINSDYAIKTETASNFDSATSITITGSGSVDLTGDVATAVTALNASANTGGVKAKYLSTTGTFTGGTGNDIVESTAGNISKAVSLGDGDDTYKLVDNATATTAITATFDGGNGIDTISMDDAKAIALDGNSVFADDHTNFEVLNINSTIADGGNINVKNLGLNKTITLNGTATTDQGTVSGIAADASITLAVANGQGDITLALDSATGSSDVITLKSEADGDLDLGKVIVASVETVNISAVDKVVDVTGAKDEFDANIADGKDDTNSVQGYELDIDEATTLNITGSADLTVDLLDTNNSGNDVQTTLVDASTFTGKFTFVADGKKSAGTTVKGGTGVNILTADGENDILIGQGSNDFFTATQLTTITGGGGNDTFRLSVGSGLLTHSTVADASAGDIVDLDLTNEGFTWNSTAIVFSGTASFNDYVLEAVSGTADADAGATTADEVLVRWFQFSGNTYVVTDRDDGDRSSVGGLVGTGGADATGFGSQDSILELQGLFDLTAATLDVTAGQLTLG